MNHDKNINQCEDISITLLSLPEILTTHNTGNNSRLPTEG